tara:strand:- start:135 stop:716 length:582 start_codon:yes stop_codon:yes gene_type:complete
MFFNRKNKSELILLKSINRKSDESSAVEINGEKVGFTMWLLSKMGLVDISYTLSGTKDKIQIKSGKSLTVFPIKELHDLNGGYKSTKLFLFLSGFIATLGFVFSLITIFTEGFGIFLLTLLITFVISGLFFWIYKISGRLYIELNTFNGITYTLYLQGGAGSIQKGERVTYETMQELVDSFVDLAKENSKYYS